MEDYESRRHELYNDLERAIGERSAGTLMTSLPPVEWGDLATKADLDAGLVSVRKDMAAEFKLVRLEMAQLGTELRTEIAQQGAELRGEIAQLGTELRGEMAQQGAELRAEIGGLRLEVVELRTKMDAGFDLMRKDFAGLREEIAGDVNKALLGFSLRLYLGLAGLLVSLAALGFTAAYFLKA